MAAIVSSTRTYAVYDEWRSISVPRRAGGSGHYLVYYARADVERTAEKLERKRGVDGALRGAFLCNLWRRAGTIVRTAHELDHRKPG